MKFFSIFLLAGIMPTIWAASNDYSPISQQETSPQAKPRLSDERRKELVEQVSYMCNPMCIPGSSIDFRRSQTERTLACCSKIPRSRYNETINELFYSNGPWDKPGNRMKKCCIQMQRNGCDGCTVGTSFIGSIVALTTCGSCAAITAACCFSPAPCNCPWSDPSLCAFIETDLVAPFMVSAVASSWASIISMLFGYKCIDELSNPKNWDVDEETPIIPQMVDLEDFSAEPRDTIEQ